MNYTSSVFLAQLNHETDRVSRLQHLLARKQAVLRDAATRLRLGVDPDVVSLDIVKAVRAELAELNVSEGSEG